MSFLYDLLFTYRYFFSWRDAVEILFFSTFIYYLSLWLKKDTQKNLLGYFYAYCITAFVAYHAQLVAISFLLVVASPLLVMFFMLMHQTTLQKNFVALRALTPATKDAPDWLETLFKSCLIALNNNKEVRCIIEHTNSLQEFLYAPLEFQTALNEDLLNIILQSSSYNQEQLVWVNSKGSLLGINTRWQGYDDAESWQEKAVFFTTKTDALIFHLSPTTRSFTIIVNGKEFSSVATSQALAFIKKYVTSPSSHPGEKKYEASITQKQPHA
ncbi:MAG TPA: hypothetical protein VLG71_00495 [Candidatus Limnocylindria bacterium]|nr:hypothetical protein [Candidatus Limnocylindria bacterium]